MLPGGGIHGALICINKLWNRVNKPLPKVIAWFLTFNAVNIAWIFFRAESFEKAKNIIGAMFFATSKVSPILIDKQGICIIVVCLFLSLLYFDIKRIERINPYIGAVIIAGLFLYSFLHMGNISEFLYFQF